MATSSFLFAHFILFFSFSSCSTDCQPVMTLMWNVCGIDGDETAFEVENFGSAFISGNDVFFPFLALCSIFFFFRPCFVFRRISAFYLLVCGIFNGLLNAHVSIDDITRIRIQM